MSFNRSIYDDCHVEQQNKDSVDVTDYQLYAGKYKNLGYLRYQCTSESGGQCVSHSKLKNCISDEFAERSLVESKLRGQGSNLTSCSKTVAPQSQSLVPDKQLPPELFKDVDLRNINRHANLSTDSTDFAMCQAAPKK